VLIRALSASRERIRVGPAGPFAIPVVGGTPDPKSPLGGGMGSAVPLAPGRCRPTTTAAPAPRCPTVACRSPSVQGTAPDCRGCGGEASQRACLSKSAVAGSFRFAAGDSRVRTRRGVGRSGGRCPHEQACWSCRRRSESARVGLQGPLVVGGWSALSDGGFVAGLAAPVGRALRGQGGREGVPIGRMGRGAAGARPIAGRARPPAPTCRGSASAGAACSIGAQALCGPGTRRHRRPRHRGGGRAVAKPPTAPRGGAAPGAAAPLGPRRAAAQAAFFVGFL
jgi:hypothetical protein